MNKIILALFFAIALLLFACGQDNPIEPGTSSSEVSSSTLSSSMDVSSSSSDVIPGTSSSISSSMGIPSSSSYALSSVTPSSSSIVASSSSVSSSSKPSSSSVVPSSSSIVVSSSSVSSSSSNPSSSSVVPSSSSIIVSSSSFSPFNHSLSYSTFVDVRDGKTYKYRKIDTYNWMAQNLDYGTQVPGTLATDNQYNDNVVEKYCYGDNAANCDKYGGLYQWAEAMALPSICDSTLCATQISTGHHQGICPAGWHVPKNAEWQDLTSSLGVGIEGTKLKSQLDWASMPGTNNTGFSALGAGSRLQTGGFVQIKTHAYFVMAWESSITGSYMYTVDYLSSAGSGGTAKKNKGNSLRCVQDY